jgi:hypothetical protein
MAALRAFSGTDSEQWDQDANGAAQESNLPSVGLPRLTGFEDRLGHQAHAAPRLT